MLTDTRSAYGIGLLGIMPAQLELYFGIDVELSLHSRMLPRPERFTPHS